MIITFTSLRLWLVFDNSCLFASVSRDGINDCELRLIILHNYSIHSQDHPVISNIQHWLGICLLFLCMFPLLSPSKWYFNKVPPLPPISMCWPIIPIKTLINEEEEPLGGRTLRQDLGGHLHHVSAGQCWTPPQPNKEKYFNGIFKRELCKKCFLKFSELH